MRLRTIHGIRRTKFVGADSPFFFGLDTGDNMSFLEAQSRTRQFLSVAIMVLAYGLALWGLFDLIARFSRGSLPL